MQEQPRESSLQTVMIAPVILSMQSIKLKSVIELAVWHDARVVAVADRQARDLLKVAQLRLLTFVGP